MEIQIQLQIPITSQHIDETLSAFDNSFNASFAPLTFLDAIALNGSVLAEVVATPIMSVIIDKDTNTIITNTATAIPVIPKPSSLTIPKHIDNANESIKIFIDQTI